MLDPVIAIEPLPVMSPPLTVKLPEPVRVPAVMVRSPRRVMSPLRDHVPEALLKVRLFKVEAPGSLVVIEVPEVKVRVPELWVKVPLLVKEPTTVRVEDEVRVPALMVRSFMVLEASVKE